VTLADTVKSDLTAAMKAGDRDRVGILRLVLSELQKAAKDGSADEGAGLRRERKRRLVWATAFREGGRPELADAEQREAEVIAAYLPAELDDAALARLVADAVAEAGATSPRDMGPVMKLVMSKAGGRADGKRVSALVKEALSG
jgi:hypothetical protein